MKRKKKKNTSEKHCQLITLKTTRRSGMELLSKILIKVGFKILEVSESFCIDYRRFCIKI